MLSKEDLKDRIERVLPAFAMAMLMDCMSKEGFELRADIVQPIRTSAALAFKGLDETDSTVVATKAYDTVNQIMHGEPGSYRQLMLAAAMFALKLVDEGKNFDPNSQAVLCGLALLDDAKTDPDNLWGYSEKKLEEAGGRILSRAMLLGLYDKNPLVMH
jgi:hypothetical protein